MIEVNVGVDLLHLLVHAVLALFGGIARELYQVQSKGFNFLSFLSNAVVSVFAGVSMFLMIANFDLANPLVAFCSCIAGWLGGNLIDFFGWLVMKVASQKAGVTLKEEELTKKNNYGNN